MINIIKALESHPIEDLIQLADKNPQIADLCKSHELQEYWKNCWSLLGDKPNHRAATDENPYRHLKPQTGFSAFTLVQGITYYHLSRIYNNDVFLLRAAELENFHAIYFLFTSQMNPIRRGENKVYQLNALIKKYEESLAHHGTPGFLLLFEAYDALGHFCKKLNLKTFPIKAEDMFRKAFYHLYAAELTKYFCETSTYNAYFGLKNSMMKLLELNSRDFQYYLHNYNEEKSQFTPSELSKESLDQMIQKKTLFSNWHLFYNCNDQKCSPSSGPSL